MTQENIESELEKIINQLSRLRDQQDKRNRIWLLVGILSLFTGVGCTVAGLIVMLRVDSMMGTPLMLTAIPLYYLSVALFFGINKIEPPSA
jgi:hypothetical protein